MADTNCLYTTVTNSSGKAMVFSFIPPHGKTLGVAQDYLTWGNLVDNMRTGGRTNLRKKAALEHALTAGLLTIKSSPNVVMYDATAVTTTMLVRDATTLGTADVCWI